jgi:hypothetical protein
MDSPEKHFALRQILPKMAHAGILRKAAKGPVEIILHAIRCIQTSLGDKIQNPFQVAKGSPG